MQPIDDQWMVTMEDGSVRMVDNTFVETFLGELCPHSDILWIVEDIECNQCRYTWLDVRPEVLTSIRCPECGRRMHL